MPSFSEMVPVCILSLISTEESVGSGSNAVGVAEGDCVAGSALLTKPPGAEGLWVAGSLASGSLLVSAPFSFDILSFLDVVKSRI